MATNTVFSYTKSEVWPVTAEVPSGTPLIKSGIAGVTIAASGGYTKSETVGPLTISGIPAGGASLNPLEASVALDGTFEFTVTGAASNTAQGTPVYITSAGALTLTATDNTAFGHVNKPADYVFKTGVLPVAIGA